MNPLTLVKRIQKINSREADLGISEQASWHAKYKDSAYVFVGGIPFDLTEGDLLAVFAQYVFFSLLFHPFVVYKHKDQIHILSINHNCHDNRDH